MDSQTPQITPNLRLDFFANSVLMTRWQKDGQVVSYPVSAQDVVTACADVDLGSGLLPRNTLFWRRQEGQTLRHSSGQVAIGIYISARRWPVHLNQQILTIPWPPLVFMGCGMQYRVFAVKKRPQLGDKNRLYHAPSPNVHHNGAICAGNTPFPVCTPNNIMTAFEQFMCHSSFNEDLSHGKCQSYEKNVTLLWPELVGKKRFPLGELVPNQWDLSRFC